MKNKLKRPPQLKELFPKILDCIAQGFYRQSRHAIEREEERQIDLLDVLFVLKNGYHEQQKTPFDELFQTYKYAIRGKTLEDLDIVLLLLLMTLEC